MARREHVRGVIGIGRRKRRCRANSKIRLAGIACFIEAPRQQLSSSCLTIRFDLFLLARYSLYLLVVRLLRGRSGNGKKIILSLGDVDGSRKFQICRRESNLPLLRRGVCFELVGLLALPLWCSGEELHTPLALCVLPLMMLTPALGVLAVWVFLPRSIQPIIPVIGLGIGQWPRCLPYWLFGWCGIIALVLAAPFVGALLGMYTLDLQNFSGFRQLLRLQPGSEAYWKRSRFRPCS